MVRRDAFTLLELIFAIVVIAISVVSLPRMTLVTAEGIDESLVQEAIFAGATELNEAVTYNWDDNSFDINKTETTARVIDTDGNCNPLTQRRPGHILGQKKHRRCTDSDANNTVSLFASNADVNSFSDINNTIKNIFTNRIRNQSGYKKEYDSILSVTYPAAFGGDANYKNDIKRLRVTVYTPDSEVVTLLDTYSCNIGEIDIYTRVMP